MSTEPITHEPDGNVVQLRPADTTPPEPPAEDRARQRRPIIPEHLRRANLPGTLTQAAGLHWHRTRYHGLRAPVYGARTLAYAARGGASLTGRVVAWWHWTNGWLLESQAIAAGRSGHHDAMRAHTEGKKTRAARGRILAVSAVAAAAVVLALAVYAPWWIWPPLGLVLVLVLARHGRPAGRPIAQAATVAPQYQPPTPEVITRALGSLGIAAISQAIANGRGITFVSDVHRDGPGWGCQLDLPHGVTARHIIARRGELASGLRRPLSATWPSGVPAEHEGRLALWIGFQDLAKMKAPAWPLLRAGEADVFAGLPFGTDPRGQRVDVGVFEVNWLIGAAPGQGKTAAVRVLGCGVALDPLAELWIHEHAGKGDLEPLSKVCHRYVSGLDDESIAYAARSLQLLRRELDRRSAAFKKIPREQKPDGKVTREMAARRGLRLHPIVAFFDEVQNVFMHPQLGEQAKDDAAYVLRVGRAYGLILVLSTQRPAADAVPTAISGIVTNRFCLKVPDQPANDLVLGTSSYRAGYDATKFRAKTDAGLGWLKAEGDPQIVKTFYLDLNATEKIAVRARALREAAGTLSGYALGVEDDGPARSFPADVLSVFAAAEARLYTETIAARLRERIPGAYAAITAAAVASQLRALQVTVKNVREPGGQPGKGCDRSAVEAVCDAR